MSDERKRGFEPFGGTIGRTRRESTPWWPEPHDTKGKPNVVVILFDDTDQVPVTFHIEVFQILTIKLHLS